MRYVAALCYALAIAAHSGALLNTLMLGALVFLGVVATLFALEAIIREAVRVEAPIIGTPPLTGPRVDEALRKAGWDPQNIAAFNHENRGNTNG